MAQLSWILPRRYVLQRVVGNDSPRNSPSMAVWKYPPTPSRHSDDDLRITQERTSVRESRFG